MNNRIRFVAGIPYRVSSKPVTGGLRQRVWTWRAVDDPRVFQEGFASRSEAIEAAVKVLVPKKG